MKKPISIFMVALMVGGVFVMSTPVTMGSGESANIKLTTSYLDDRFPKWSPDSSEIIYTHWINDWERGIYIMNADGTNNREIHFSYISNHERFSPNGTKIIFTEYHDDSDREIAVMNADGSNVKIIYSGGANHWPSYSPDGSKIAFSHTTVESRGNPEEIYVMNSDGTNVQQLTHFSPDICVYPVWSPDGKYIYFDRQSSTGVRIYRMNADGSCVIPITPEEYSCYSPSLSPDGKYMVYTSSRYGNYDLYIMNLQTGEERRITDYEGNEEFPEWSPDGEKIVFSSDIGGNYDVYVIYLNKSYSEPTKENSIILEDDFDSYVPGTFPSQGGWELIYNGYGTEYQVVDDASSVSPPNSLKLEGSANWGALAYHPISYFPNILYYEVDVLITQPGENVMNYGDGYVGFYNPNEGTWGSTFASVRFGNSDNMYIHTPKGQNKVPFNFNTWYHIKVCADMVNRTYTVWINGSLLESDIPFESSGTPTGFKLDSECNTHVVDRFDNIKIYTNFYKKILDWDVYRDAYNFSNQGTKWSPGGNCYGISSTEILYYEHYILGDSSKPYFPKQNNPSPNCTHELKLPTYVYNKLNNVSLAITIHQLFQGYDIRDSPNSLAGMGNITVVRNNKKINLFYGIPSETNLKENFEFINDSLSSGKPVLMALLPTRNQIGTEYERDDHAVVVWGIERYNNTVKMFISDPNEPNKKMFAYYFINNNTFRYTPGKLDSKYRFSNPYGVSGVDEFGRHYPNWRYFGAVSPNPMKKDWFSGWNNDTIWYNRGWWPISNLLSKYIFIIGDKNLVVKAKSKLSSNWLVDSFEERGNSQTFVQGIPESAGITEGNIEIFAIPKYLYWDYDADPTVSGSSFIYTFTIENTTDGLKFYGYLLNMSGTNYNYNVEINNLTQGISLKSMNNSVNLDLTVMHADAKGHYYVLNATNLPIEKGDKHEFVVKDWTMLNSTTKPSVRMNVYKGDSSTIRASYDLANGQEGLSTTGQKDLLGQYWWAFLILAGVAIAIIVALLLWKKTRKPPTTQYEEYQQTAYHQGISNSKEQQPPPPPPEY